MEIIIEGDFVQFDFGKGKTPRLNTQEWPRLRKAIQEVFAALAELAESTDFSEESPKSL